MNCEISNENRQYTQLECRTGATPCCTGSFNSRAGSEIVKQFPTISINFNKNNKIDRKPLFSVSKFEVAKDTAPGVVS